MATSTFREQHVRFSYLMLSVRLSLWLLALPLRLYRYPLPIFLERLTTPAMLQSCGNPLELERVIQLVLRLCHWRLFCLPLFPRTCLRQSLALYYALSRLGYSVTIHFGVNKAGDVLRGHSWVTFQGTPVADSQPAGVFQQVYSYSSGTRSVSVQSVSLAAKQT